MSTPSLSFIMPIFEPDLVLFDKVLKALTTQSIKDYEVIFVLDGPNAAAQAAISRAFKKVDVSVKVVELLHGGAQKARNAGFEHAKGRYVVFFDCDCVIEPHAALSWVEILDADPKYGFIYSGYQFENEQGAINSEPFDPWTLRVRNYISACFPLRRELVPKWNESLESLQDWDFWLSVVEKGAKGLFLEGYAFSTAFPTPKSISGKGCAPDKWLERMDKVRALHDIPKREVCVTSVNDRLDGIALAKAIDADYDDRPNDKPNHYKTIIQLGFSVKPGEMDRCASAWGKQHKKIIFWTADDVEAIHDTVSLRALSEYAPQINNLGQGFVEDNKAREIMTKAGFNVSVLPLPVISSGEVDPLPHEAHFLCDVGPTYGHVFNAIQRAIPDIKLSPVGGTQTVGKYTGLISFRQDRLVRPSVKRMLAAGRHVVSNIQQPFTNFVNDGVSDAVFMKSFVSKIRAIARAPQNKEAVKYWIDPRRIDRIAEVVK